MKLLYFLLPILLVSCSSTDEKTPTRKKSGNPEAIQFFETYTLKDLSAEWLDACNYSAKTDPTAVQGEIPLNLLGLKALRKLVLVGENPGAMGYAKGWDRLAVDSILAIPEIAKLFPKDLQFMWAMNPSGENYPALYELYAIKLPHSKKARIDGRHIVEAVPVEDEHTGSILINLTMTPKGTSEWEGMTRDNVDRFIAITMDHKVLSCPKVLMAITGGETQISGNFSMEEAGELSDRIHGEKR